MGQNSTPKNELWVFKNEDPRYRINPSLLPDLPLTGVYGFAGIEASVNLYVISGGVELNAGLGVISGYEFPPYQRVLGHVGVYIWGDILGGVVSASGWGTLDFSPPDFYGSIGVEGCVLFVCESVDVGVRLGPGGLDID